MGAVCRKREQMMGAVGGGADDGKQLDGDMQWADDGSS
jgi:hypothetical protein